MGKKNNHKGSPSGFKMCSCSMCRYGRRGADFIFKRAKGHERLVVHATLKLYAASMNDEVLDVLPSSIWVPYTD